MRTPRGLTLLEIIVVIVMVALFAALLLPLLPTRKIHARRTQCASNIRQMVIAMYLYSDVPGNGGYFPTDAPTTNDPFAASSGAACMGMLYRQFVIDRSIFSCPGNPIPPEAKLSTIQPWPTDGKVPRLFTLRPEQTSYAYDPGHGSETSAIVVIVADKQGGNGNSDNHGPAAGQNVGFGTSVEFRETVKNPLGEGRMDNDIYTLGDTTPGTNGIKVSRDEESYIRP